MKNLVLILAAIFVFGCAKNRDAEPLRAGDTENIYTKDSLVRPINKKHLLDKAELVHAKSQPWLGKVTVVNTSDSPAGTVFIGYQGEVKLGYFDFTETKLQFRSLMGLQEGKESENIKNSVLLNWDVEHIDFTLDENDGQTTNKEIFDNFKTWNQKKHFRIKWGSQLNNESQMLPTSSFALLSCWDVASVRRVDNSFKVEEDHIGFKVEVTYQRKPACGSAPQWNEGDFNFTATYMYSFRRFEKTDYQPKVFSNEQDPARYKYGHFQTVRKIINPNNSRPHNIFMENRWAEKTQHFYFVKGFPEKYKWIWKHSNPHSVLGQTNALLKSLGSKLEFQIHEYNYNHETGKNDGPAREFGDLRYSFVNFIEELEAGGTPLGYGPSDTNPLTGEIIAANTMVWTGMLDFYMQLTADVGKGAQKESSLFAQLDAALKTASNGDATANASLSDWDQTQGVGKLFKKMAQKTRYGFPFWNSYTSNEVGEIVLPTVVEKYKHGIPGVGSTSKNISHYLTEVLSLPASQTSFDFVTQHLNGRPQAKVRNPYDILDISWLDRLANSGDAQVTSGLRDFVGILKNIKKFSDKNYSGPDGLKNISEEYYQGRVNNIKANQEGHCILDMDEFAGGLAGVLSAKKLDFTDEQVRKDFLNTVLYRVSIHEFGHNLNLRHNFYGSIDKENFGVGHDHSIADFPGSNGLVQLDENGEPIQVTGFPQERVQVSSSVMDYLRLEDEINTPWAWEDYDVAALRDSYQPQAFDDKGHLYLFCTDEHTLSSALCNRHDLGTTPTQILMSQIRSYDERYEMRNTRYGRAYWNTSGYASQVFGAMLSMKEFLAMWRTAFTEDIVFEELDQMGIKNKNIQRARLEELNREMREVMKLTLAFYQAVIQQSRGDRDYRSKYDLTTGALKQMGIMADKIYAMLFLAGDDALFYNPDRIMLHSSYLTYSREPGLGEFTDQIWRNIVTDRNVAMEPWFINFARFQYAKNATNYNNRGASDLIGAMKVIRLEKAKDLKDQYGIKIDKSLPVLRTRLPKLPNGGLDATFKEGTEVVIVHVDGSYYMTAVAEGHITFSLFQEALFKLTGSGDDDESITQFNMDVREFHWLYNLAKQGALQ